MSIHVHLCCNDPDNGQFVGKAECVEIESIRLVGGCIKVKQAQNEALGFGRLKVNCRAYEIWFGNWCWDRAFVSAVDALRMLNYLIRLGWHCEEGPGFYRDRINAGKEITPEEWISNDYLS